MSERVTRSSLHRLTPILQPQSLFTLPSRVWSDDEWSLIQQGYRSRSMEERWHIFAEDDRLYLHRSWLGDGKYEATFQTVAGGRRISEIKVESGPDSYPGGSDEAKCVLLELLICSILLGEQGSERRERLKALHRRGSAKPRPVVPKDM